MGIPVHELAHARAGDKGDTSNIGVFGYDDDSYQILKKELTAARVENELEEIIEGSVTRYDLPQLNGFNFVLEGALAGGVTTSVRVDTHGKSLSYALLDIVVDVEK
ncbi:AtuA-related protein [Haladaptatus caseinilyticus]|uniref:AtuA-related protein n=1 Tax=Haladaptatus caseinilyticus TaxID=2993314 RepID=UPI00224A781F|nr:hypothetical protein [Haladaptatus caseinilyticus]